MNILLLTKLISIPSVFPNEKKLSNYINTWIIHNVPQAKMQIQKVSDNRVNLLYSKGNGKKTVMLIGHLDTIPVIDGWKTNPYKPQIKNDTLYGLGSWDMKAGLYIILQCFKKYNPKNIILKIAFTVDEENYSQGAHVLVKSDFIKDADLILVPEPGFTHGHNGITVGRTGRSTYMVNISGKSAHGSKSQEGVNAILEAQLFINEALKIGFSKDYFFGRTTIFPRTIQSSVKGFSVPDRCEIELDCKLVPPDSPEIVLKKLIALSKKMFQSKKLVYLPVIKFRTRPTPFCLPYRLNKNDKYVKLCESIVKKVTGKAIVFYRDTVADECIYVEKLGIPTISIGPQGENAHKENESVFVSSVKTVEKIYLTILKTIDVSN